MKKALNTLISQLKCHPADVILFIVMMVLGTQLRLWWVQTIPTEQLYDFSTYYEVAVNLSRGLGYTFQGQPIAFQGMGYSMLLGLFFKIVGLETELAAKYFNVILSMWTVGMTYFIAGRLSTRRTIRWAALVIMTVMPQQIAYTNVIGTEILSAAILSTLMLVQSFGEGMNRKVQWGLFGLLTAALALTKPFYLAYPVAVFFYEWLTEKAFRRGVSGMLMTAAVMMLLIAPWTYRNYQHFGRLIPISYNSGLVLYLNNNANNTHGGYMPLEEIVATPELQAKIDEHLNNGAKSIKLASDLELDLKPAAQQWIKEHPIEFFKLGIIRVHSTFFNGSWDIDAWAMNQYKTLVTDRNDVETVRHLAFFRSINDMILTLLSGAAFLFFFTKLPGFFAALFSRSRKFDWKIALLMLPIGYNGLVIFIYEGQPRYNFNLLFVFVLCLLIIADRFLGRGEPTA